MVENEKKIEEIREQANEQIEAIRRQADKLFDQIREVKWDATAKMESLHPQLEIHQGSDRATFHDSGNRMFDCSICYKEGYVGNMVCSCDEKYHEVWKFDYFVLAGTTHPVCDECAAKYAPDFAQHRRDAFEMAKIEIDSIKEESSYAAEAFHDGGKSAFQIEIKGRVGELIESV